MTDNALDDIGPDRGSDLAAELDGELGVDSDVGSRRRRRETDEFSDALGPLNSDTFALWQGDQGNLDPKQRDTLVALLKKSFISSDDKDAWRTLMRDPGPIVTSLNNLYFILVVDERAEVAFATPARNADNPFKTLVRDAPEQPRRDAAAHLPARAAPRRDRVRAADRVRRCTAMLDYVERFRPTSATDVSGDEKRVYNAIGGLVTSGLLVKTADADRYRVHRAIEALLPLPTLNQLVGAFRAHNAGAPPSRRRQRRADTRRPQGGARSGSATSDTDSPRRSDAEDGEVA